MNERPPVLSESLIEAALARRAPGHADASLLAAIVAEAVVTRQVRDWRLNLPTGRVRTRTWVALAAAAALVGALLLSAVGGRQPTVTPPPSGAPSVSPAGPTSRTSPSVSPSTVACLTDTTRVTVGDAMPPTTTPPMTVPAGVLDRGAYLTLPNDSGSSDLWSIRTRVANRIANVDIGRVLVRDISSDGRQVLLQVGEMHGGIAGPECDDLYVIRTDRPSVTRVTHNGTGEHAFAGSFSVDGRYVAFRYESTNAVAPAVGVSDLLADITPQLRLCDGNATTIQIAWAPDNDRLAALCPSVLQLEFVPTSTSTIDVPFAVDSVGTFGWASPTRIVIGTVPTGPGASPITLHTLSLTGVGAHEMDGTFSNSTPTTQTFTSVADNSGEVSPDGRSVLVNATPADGPQVHLDWLVVDLATGRTTLEIPLDLPDRASWSEDSQSIVYVEPTSGGPGLTVVDIASGDHHTYGSMPTEFLQGVWRGL
jgi:hypothetical protein